jgi:TRAP transporter TAXI family solute receptor
MLKKVSHILLLVLLFTAVFASGCSTTDQGASTENNEVQNITIGVGTVGGSWYIFGAQLSEVLQNEIPDLTVSAIESGGAANIRLTNEGVDMDMGIASLHSVFEALEKKGAFQDDNIENVAPIVNITSQDILHFAVLANSGINKFEDLADKRILPGAVGTEMENLCKLMLELHGLSYEKIIANGGAVNHASAGESA